jgi:hypothetical protein
MIDPSKLILRSGGQSGVDRAALDVATAHDVQYGGWCPKGGWAEDFPTPPGLVAKYPRVSETPSRAPEQRTAWNVRDSHGTLIVVPDIDIEESEGTRFTRCCAELIFLRPVHVASLAGADAVDRATEWLAGLAQRVDSWPLILNVAGPRESESLGIGAAAATFLEALFSGPWAEKVRR